MIYFIRHGQTNYNLQNKVQGHIDTTLNNNGIIQAKNISEKLKNINFDMAFCSPLKRAKQTLSIIYDTTKKNYYVDNRLIERDFGIYEGKSVKEFNHPLFWNGNYQNLFNNAETLDTFIYRVYCFLEDIKKYKDKNILIVSHGGVLMAMKSYFYGKPKNNDYFSYLEDNGKIVIFNFT